MEIKELPEEVRNHLRSGFQMTNVIQCVNELVFNSLDAISTKIAVRINMKMFRIQVVDNGVGITKNNLDLLTKRYMTNKCHTVDDYKKTTTYGYKGESLSSIRNNCKKIIISTRCPPDEATYTKIFEGDVANDTIVANHRPSQGTTITVEGFLYNLPVRQKGIDSDVELNHVKTNLELLAIIQPSISFSLRNEERRLMMLITNTADTVERALIAAYPDVERKHLFSVKVKRCENISISALVSTRRLEGAKVQLLYVNKRPVNCSRLNNFIDDIFQGTIDSGVGHFVYIVNIKCPYSNVSVAPSSFSKYTVEFRNWTVVLKYIEKMLKKFLQSHNLLSTSTVTKKKEIEEKNMLGNIDGACQAKATKRKLDTSVTAQKNIPDIPDKIIKLSGTTNKNERSNNKLEANAEKNHKRLRKTTAKKRTNGPRTKARVSGISKATAGIDNNKIDRNISNYLLKRSSALRATAIRHETYQEIDNQSHCNFEQVPLNSRKGHLQKNITALRATAPVNNTHQKIITQSLSKLEQVGMKNNVTCSTSSSKLVRYYTKKMLMLEDVDNQNIGKAIIMDKFLKSSDKQWDTQGEPFDRKTAISVSVKIKRRSENSRHNVSVFNFECQTNFFESCFHHNKFSNRDIFNVTVPRNHQFHLGFREEPNIYKHNDIAENDENMLSQEPIFSKILENVSTFARTHLSKIGKRPNFCKYELMESDILAGVDERVDKAYFEFLQPSSSNSVGIFRNVQHGMRNLKKLNRKETPSELDISYLSQMNNFRNYVQSTQVLNNSLINVEVKQNVTIMKDCSLFFTECNKSRFSINYCDNSVNKMEYIRNWVKNCEAYNSTIQQTYTSHTYENYLKNDNERYFGNKNNCFRREPPKAVVNVLEDVVIRPITQDYTNHFLLQHRQNKDNLVQKRMLQNRYCSIIKPLPNKNIFKRPLTPPRVKTIKSILTKNHKDKIRIGMMNTDTFCRNKLIYKSRSKLFNNNNTEDYKQFKFPQLHSDDSSVQLFNAPKLCSTIKPTTKFNKKYKQIKRTPPRVEAIKSILKKNHKDKIRIGMMNTDTFSRNKLIHKARSKLINNNNTEGYKQCKFPQLHLDDNSMQLFNAPKICSDIKPTTAFNKKYEQMKRIYDERQCDIFKLQFNPTTFNNNNEYSFTDLKMHIDNFEELPDDKKEYEIYSFHPNMQRSLLYNFNQNTFSVINSPKNIRKNKKFTKEIGVKKKSAKPFLPRSVLLAEQYPLDNQNVLLKTDFPVKYEPFKDVSNNVNIDYQHDKSIFFQHFENMDNANFSNFYNLNIDQTNLADIPQGLRNLYRKKSLMDKLNPKHDKLSHVTLNRNLVQNQPQFETIASPKCSVHEDGIKYRDSNLINPSSLIKNQETFKDDDLFISLNVAQDSFIKQRKECDNVFFQESLVGDTNGKIRKQKQFTNPKQNKLSYITPNRNLVQKQSQFEIMSSPNCSVQEDGIENRDSDLINSARHIKHQETFKDDDLFISLNVAQDSFNKQRKKCDDVIFQESLIDDTNGKNNKQKQFADFIAVTNSGCSNPKMRPQNITSDIFISASKSTNNIKNNNCNLKKNVKDNITNSLFINTSFSATPKISGCKDNLSPATENQAFHRVQKHSRPKSPPAGVFKFKNGLDDQHESKQNKLMNTHMLMGSGLNERKTSKSAENKIDVNQSFCILKNISNDSNLDNFPDSFKKVTKGKSDDIKDHRSQFPEQKCCLKIKKKKKALLQKRRNNKHSTLTDKVLNEQHTFTAKEESETKLTHTPSKQHSVDNTSLNCVEQIGGGVVEPTTKRSPNEWIEQYNTLGDKIFVNLRTGMIRTSSPNEKTYNMKSRISFVPKGLSPILSSKQVVHSSITASTKDKLYEAIAAAYEKELGIIKWQNIAKNQDLKSFFDAVFSKLSRKTAVIPDVSKKIQQRILAKSHEGLHSYNFSKEIFRDVTVVGQMDKKFIVGLLEQKSLLLLFDQHAAHERIRVEKLTKEYTLENALGSKMYKCQRLDQDLQLQLSKEQVEILATYKHRFRKLGLSYRLNEDLVEIIGVPYCFSKKGCHDKKMDKLKNLVISLIEEETDNIQMIKGVPSNIPRTIQNVINSEACRGAIMFGDKLSIQHCKKLLRKLTVCKLPFQCAHGRPTITPLIQLKSLDYEVPRPHLERLKNKNKIYI